jgi:hypothetical protein
MHTSEVAFVGVENHRLRMGPPDKVQSAAFVPMCICAMQTTLTCHVPGNRCLFLYPLNEVLLCR